jgi:hypothetical protein
MTLSKTTEKKEAVHQLDTFEDLSVQDALAIIAIFAAQMVPDDSEEDRRRIADVFQNHPAFEEHRQDILKRINKFGNAMLAADKQSQVKTVEIAINVLTPSLQNATFELAAEVALWGKALADEKKTVLDTLKTMLKVDRDFAQKVVEKFTRQTGSM